jgi:hypothetical protein
MAKKPVSRNSMERKKAAETLTRQTSGSALPQFVVWLTQKASPPRRGRG